MPVDSKYCEYLSNVEDDMDPTRRPTKINYDKHQPVVNNKYYLFDRFSIVFISEYHLFHNKAKKT